MSIDPDRLKPAQARLYLRTFYISASAGALFGLVISFVFLGSVDTHISPGLFILGLTVMAGLFSGLAGIGAAFLEKLLSNWGLQQPHLRALISFCAVALLTVAITYFAMVRFGALPSGAGLQRYTIWGLLSGLGFGAVFAMYSFRSEMSRQKVLLLEMENRHLAELADREKLLQEAARNLAVMEERNRLARELHDSIAQGMHGIIYSLHSLRNVLAENEPGRAILTHLEETANSTLNELRHLVMELSPSSLDEHGLGEALRLHCDLFARRQPAKVHLHINYNGGLSPDQELALYRIAQEALANVQQHAGASRVDVVLNDDGTAVRLTVCDDGRGFAAAAAASASAGGHGLGNMATRSRQSGGRLQIESGSGKGTTISVVVPK